MKWWRINEQAKGEWIVVDNGWTSQASPMKGSKRPQMSNWRVADEQVNGYRWVSERSPAVPDSDLTVVVSTNEEVVCTHQVTAVRHHLHYLHTWTFPSWLSEWLTRDCWVITYGADLQAALWRSQCLIVLSALPVATWWGSVKNLAAVTFLLWPVRVSWYKV